MRRKDREITKQKELLAILDQCSVCRIALEDLLICLWVKVIYLIPKEMKKKLFIAKMRFVAEYTTL